MQDSDGHLYCSAIVGGVVHTCSGEVHLGALRSAAMQGEDAAQSETHPHLQEERRHPSASNRDRDLHILKNQLKTSF